MSIQSYRGKPWRGGGRLDPPGFRRVKQIVACRLVFDGMGCWTLDGSTPWPGPTSFSKFVIGMLSINLLDKGKTTVYTPSHERTSTCVLLDQLTLALPG